jgi:hypothetical protein
VLEQLRLIALWQTVLKARKLPTQSGGGSVRRKQELNLRNPKSAVHLMATRAVRDYSRRMNDKKPFFNADKVGLALAAAFLVTLTGCVGYVDGPRAGVYMEPAVQVDAGFVGQDDYVYYPGYQMYYGSRSHRWYDREGSSWVAHPAPRGVSVEALHSSPSVRMDFHDSPEHHHSEVVRQYPKNWKPAGSHQGRQDNQKNDNRRQQDHRDGNNGR